MTRGDPNRALRAFEAGFLPWMRTRVRSMRITGIRELDDRRPLMLVANHVSWWDGFIVREVQRVLRPRAPFSVLMDRDQLSRFGFFRWFGAVGIEPGSAASTASALRQLRRRSLEHPDLTIAFFPQGRIWPSTRRPLGFERGVEVFARRLGAVVLPMGIHLEPLQHVAPTCYVSLGMPQPEGSSVASLEAAVTDELEAILRHVGVHGEDADRFWPPRAGTLPRPGATQTGTR